MKHNARLEAVKSLMKFLHKSEADRFKPAPVESQEPKQEETQEPVNQEAMEALEALTRGE